MFFYFFSLTTSKHLTQAQFHHNSLARKAFLQSLLELNHNASHSGWLLWARPSTRNHDAKLIFWCSSQQRFSMVHYRQDPQCQTAPKIQFVLLIYYYSRGKLSTQTGIARITHFIPRTIQYCFFGSFLVKWCFSQLHTEITFFFFLRRNTEHCSDNLAWLDSNVKWQSMWQEWFQMRWVGGAVDLPNAHK